MLSAVDQLEFFIDGVPAPGGSKRGFAIKKGGVYTGRVIITDDAGQRNKDWKTKSGWCGREAMLHANLPLLHSALEVEFHFEMPRLKSHFNSKRLLKQTAPIWHQVRPDLTKLIRSTEDGLSGIVWADDNQIGRQVATKRYGDKAGCRVVIRIMGEPG